MRAEQAIEMILAHLRATKGEWELEEGRFIRRGKACPITDKAGGVAACALTSAAKKLGIHPRTARRIALAADNGWEHCNPITSRAARLRRSKLRIRMFKAAGMI
jgi:hypothetical protein